MYGKTEWRPYGTDAPYDYDKLWEKIEGQYRKLTGSKGKPSTTFKNLVDCMDAAFVNEWMKQVGDYQKNLVTAFEETQRKVEAVRETCRKIEESDTEISDSRVRDALKAYTTIVSMDFDNPQQKLANIQNASYFIWALYAGEPGKSPAETMGILNKDKAPGREIKEET